MDNVSLGELIRKKRKEKQMTQGELASLLYVSTNAISKWELGKNSIDSQNREKLAELLDIPHTLLFDEPPEIPTPADSLTNTDTTGCPPPSPEIDESIPPEPAALPVTITEKKTGLKMIPFILLAIGCILITATFIVCSMRLKNRDSFSIQDEYYATTAPVTRYVTFQGKVIPPEQMPWIISTNNLYPPCDALYSAVSFKTSMPPAAARYIKVQEACGRSIRFFGYPAGNVSQYPHVTSCSTLHGGLL